MAGRRGRGSQQQRDMEWDFFSFPVYFAFAGGAFVASILAFILGDLFFLVWAASLFGVSFGLAHTFSHWLRNRSTARASQRRDEDERERRALAARGINPEDGGEDGEASEGSQRSRRRRRKRG